MLPENWDTLLLFLALATQWRIGGMGGFLGLDYSAVESTLRLMGLWRRRAELFSGLQVMERAALPVLNKS